LFTRGRRVSDREAGKVVASIDEDVRLRALRQYGNSALARSVTFQPMEYFGDEEGFLGYKQVGSTAFVLANPVTPVTRWEALIRRFVSERNDVCFWQASRSVGDILARNGLAQEE